MVEEYKKLVFSDEMHNRSHDHSLVADGSPIAVAGVPNLPASKITSGQLPLARLDSAVCSETEADGKITTHKNDANAHHAQSHTLASHSTKAHSELTGVTASQHHTKYVHPTTGTCPQSPKAHTLASHSTKAHTELTGVTADQHHPQAHTLASHSTKAHSELTGVTTSQHHTKYTDASAKAAAVQAGAITNGVTKAPTHDAVYDVKTMVEGHSDRHENAGADEISVAGLSGELADNQPPKAHKNSHDPIDGSDKLDTAIPVKVGAANAIGSSHSLARADHVHEREHAKTVDASELTAGLLALARLPATLTGKDADSVDGKQPGTAIGDIAYYNALRRVYDSDRLDGYHETSFGRLSAARTWALTQTFAAAIPIKTNKISERTLAAGVDIDNCLIKDGKAEDSIKLEGSTKAQVQDHTPKAHTLASHSTKAHSELTGVTASQHHTKYVHPTTGYCPQTPKAHEYRHVAGGADDIDSALAIAAMANLSNGKIWKGNASNRPIETDVPGVPSGVIAMWHGTRGNIPAGWVICDGNNSTPNLLARFVQGVATAGTNPGATGGATLKNLDRATQENYGMGAIVGTDAAGGGMWTKSGGGTFFGLYSKISDIRPLFYDIAFIMKT